MSYLPIVFNIPLFQKYHCSPISAADKPNGKVCLILDMSAPHGDALNDHIDKEKFAFHYSNFDNAMDLINKLGKGAFMCTLDLKNRTGICSAFSGKGSIMCM